MCGILGIAAVRPSSPRLSESQFATMLRTLERRGPDGLHEWRFENVALAHTRLIVRDRTRGGEQPMASADGRWQLVYNGELYNDEELRAELRGAGAVPDGFRSRCDAETVVEAFAQWGVAALARFRGMFALAAYDRREHVLHLARDPLGIKPLYYQFDGRELTFASSPRAILAHPAIEARPDLAMVSAYMSTVRNVLGHRTLFEGIHVLTPGERARFDTTRGELELARFHDATAVDREAWEPEAATAALREAMRDSVARHTTADVPISAFLSGGVDSSIICHLIRELEGPGLETWCSGGQRADGTLGEDFAFARRVAEALECRHHEVVVDESRFAEDWRWMIGELGVPLCTPNEVAIHAIAREMRNAGLVVALSGEGADELFAGYGPVTAAARAFEADPADTRSGGRFQLEASAWMQPGVKRHLFGDEQWAALGGDDFLVDFYERTFERAAREAGEGAEPIEAHLRFLRHVNLTGLLQRLDTSTMLESIEGRTPFADAEVLRLAERFPVDLKDGPPDVEGGEPTKLVLRRALRGFLPTEISERPKLSFPLPFEQWMVDNAGALEESRFVRELFDRQLLDEIARRPAEYFQFAWPLVNLAIWGEVWWD